jgi:hypothetical protein
MSDSKELRKWAAWYREIAERTGNPTIWAMPLHTAEKLEAEADRLEYSKLVSVRYEVGAGIARRRVAPAGKAMRTR